MPILSNAAQNLPSPPESLPDPHAIARDVTPANDAHAHDPLPTCALTDARRAELAAEAARVPAPKVKPLPAHLDERLRWLGGILATAWTDQADLARVPLGGESPVTRAELVTFGERIAYAREAVVGRAIASPTDLSKLSDTELRRVTRAAQKTLCHALPVWFFGKEAEAVTNARAVLREVDTAKAGKHVTSNTVKLLKVVDGDARIEPWLRGLPRGEGDALDTLRAEHPEWVRREQLAASPQSKSAPVDDRAARAWALVTETLERILQAGRYLTRARTDRARAYRGFARPAATRKRVAKKSAPNGNTPPAGPTPDASPRNEQPGDVTHG
jgi:hypothetical protein